MTNKKIAILDDDFHVCDSLAWLIEMMDYKVSTYHSPLAFLEEVSKNKPDCILLDFRLPEMSGLQVLMALKKQHIDTPVIFISGHADEHFREEVNASGAFGILFKPINNDRLLKLISEACMSTPVTTSK